MHRRQAQPRSFGTTLAIVALLCAAAYQLFTKGLPEQFSAEAVQIAPSYDAAAAGDALELFRGKD
jgi:hypothetical protein